MAKRTQIEQELFKRKKIIRTITRLKHSLAADDEINELIDAEQRKFETNVQKGVLPAPIDIEAIRDKDPTPDP